MFMAIFVVVGLDLRQSQLPGLASFENFVISCLFGLRPRFYELWDVSVILLNRVM